MSQQDTELLTFEELRPQILALLELHRAAQTDEARTALVALFERAFLATAWHVAQDLLANGWAPAIVSTARSGGGQRRLTLVGGSDAA